MSTQKAHTLSFFTALLITINTMFGAGIFLNTAYLINTAGFLGFVSYSIVALALVPLIIAMIALTKRYPGGGFYHYAAHALGPLGGFTSAWFYFVGKLASATLLIHVFSTLLQQVVGAAQLVSAFQIDCFIILLFTVVNYFGVKLGKAVIATFFMLKVVPVLFMILAGLYLIGSWHVPAHSLVWSEIPSTLPMVLYAFLGFETACAISLHIKDPQIHTARIIRYSFCFTIIITTIYQLMAYLAIGAPLTGKSSFLLVFPTLFGQLFPIATAGSTMALDLIHIAVACASLGGSYGMIFGNAWNLYILAQHKHLFFAPMLRYQNRFQVPFFCFIVEAIVCALYLMVTGGQQVALQQISVFGCSLTFALSVIALLMLQYRSGEKLIHPIIGFGALFSCLVLLSGCVRNFLLGAGAVQPALYFVLLSVAGIAMYGVTRHRGH